MDLALNNQQRLIYHKTQPTNQPTWNQALTTDICVIYIYIYMGVCACVCVCVCDRSRNASDKQINWPTLSALVACNPIAFERKQKAKIWILIFKARNLSLPQYDLPVTFLFYFAFFRAKG